MFESGLNLDLFKLGLILDYVWTSFKSRLDLRAGIILYFKLSLNLN